MLLRRTEEACVHVRYGYIANLVNTCKCMLDRKGLQLSLSLSLSLSTVYGYSYYGMWNVSYIYLGVIAQCIEN